MGDPDALEEITGDELLDFREVVDDIGTFRCPMERKRKTNEFKKKKKKSRRKKYIRQKEQFLGFNLDK